jgi:hypothetical protein
VRKLFEEHGGEKLGEESGSNQFCILGGQMVEMEKTLESFEDRFNLPAEAVNLQNFFGRQLVAAGGFEQQDVPCEFQRLGLDLCAIPARVGPHMSHRPGLGPSLTLDPPHGSTCDMGSVRASQPLAVQLTQRNKQGRTPDRSFKVRPLEVFITNSCWRRPFVRAQLGWLTFLLAVGFAGGLVLSLAGTAWFGNSGEKALIGFFGFGIPMIVNGLGTAALWSDEKRLLQALGWASTVIGVTCGVCLFMLVGGWVLGGDKAAVGQFFGFGIPMLVCGGFGIVILFESEGKRL